MSATVSVAMSAADHARLNGGDIGRCVIPRLEDKRPYRAHRAGRVRLRERMRKRPDGRRKVGLGI